MGEPKVMFTGIDVATPLTASGVNTLKANGVQFVGRYLGYSPTGWKHLRQSEVDLLNKAGIMLFSIYQRGKDTIRQGIEQGLKDGIDAAKRAESFGQPKGTAIYYAVDYDAPASDYDQIASYLEGARRAHPQYAVGVYGSYKVIEEMAKRKAADHFFQTYAWSKGLLSRYANIYQWKNDTSLGGLTVDLCKSYGNEGFWGEAVKLYIPQGVGDDKLKEVEELRKEVESLKKEIAQLKELPTVPDWVKPQIEWAKSEGILTDEKGTRDFYRAVTMIYNLVHRGKSK